MKISNPPEKPKHEIVWEEFWKDICSNNDGTPNFNQIKKELADFNFILDQLPKIYSNLTGGLLSKPMYEASTIINKVDDYYKECIFPDIFDDFIDSLEDNEDINQTQSKYFKDKFKEYI